MPEERSSPTDRTSRPLPPVPPERSVSRLWLSARLRRILVYGIAAVVVLYVALTAVRLASPPDPYGPVRVETLPGYTPTPGAEPTRVTYDAATGQTVLEVTQADGVVRRFRVEKEGDGWRVYEASQ